jgi:tetratricopeptide (TPR) repeat protein
MSRKYVTVLRAVMTVSSPGRRARKLSEEEARLLGTLVAARGEPVAKKALRETISPKGGSDTSLQKAVSRLRAKVGKDLVGTDWGHGYHFEASRADADVYLLIDGVAEADAQLTAGSLLEAQTTAAVASKYWHTYPVIDMPDARAALRRGFAIQIECFRRLQEPVRAAEVRTRAGAVLNDEDFALFEEDARPRPGTLDEDIERASLLLDRGRTADILEARDLLEQVIRTHPNSQEAQSLRVLAYYHLYFRCHRSALPLGDFERDIRHVLRAREDCASAHYLMTCIFFELGLGEQELRQARDAKANTSGLYRATLAAARAYLDTGQAAQAEALVLDVLHVRPSSALGLELLLFARLYLAEYAQAVDVARRYLEERPLNGTIAWGLALAHIHLDEYDAAIGVLNDAIEEEPDNVTLWVQLVNAHTLKNGEATGRRIALRGCVALDAEVDADRTSNFRYLVWFAELLAQAGQRELVERIADRVRVETSPNGYLSYRLAFAFARLGMTGAALELLHNAVRYGFRSVEQVRQELIGIPAFAAGGLSVILAAMDAEVDALRIRYAGVGA